MKIKRYLSVGGMSELPEDEAALIEMLEEDIDVPQMTSDHLGDIVYETEDGEFRKLYIEINPDIIDLSYAASYLGLTEAQLLAGYTHKDSA